MNQRVMIAMAIACNPRLLIADEPTTALDVTIQAQILDLLRNLQKERGMALVLITHNMGVVSEMAQRVAVMYAGQVMEQQPRRPQLFASPQHPYTEALLAALPERGAGRAPAGHHPRRGARRVRPAGRLPVRAALRLCHRAFAWPCGPSCATGRAARCAATIRWAIRSAKQRIARDAPVPMEVVRMTESSSKPRTCAQVYTIRRGLFRAPAQLQAVGGVSFAHRSRQDAGGGRRIGLRQVDAGAHGVADREAHRRAR